MTLLSPNGAEMRLQVIRHSLEVEFDIGAVRLETHFGTI